MADNGAEYYRRFLEGDEEGLSEIVREYRDALIQYLQTVVFDYHAAEELAQETFFRLLVRKPKYSGRCSFKVWLWAIRRNAAVDWIRQRAKISYIPAE